jgi:hypothetical protein
MNRRETARTSTFLFSARARLVNAGARLWGVEGPSRSGSEAIRALEYFNGLDKFTRCGWSLLP